MGPDTKDVAIAAFFGITQAAVSQWDEDAPIPERRALKAIQKRPDLFGKYAAPPEQPLSGVEGGRHAA